jgi:hypothetical protein
VFLASNRRRTDESDEPLVDAGAVVRTVLREGHDVGVIEGVDDAASNRFLRLRDHRKGHLIDVSHVHKGEALIGVGVVKDGATDGRGGVNGEELLESTVRGGDPRGSADGKGLEEALAALLADALTVLLSGGEHRGEQKGSKASRGFNTVWLNANANEEKVRDRRESGKTTNWGAADAEFERSERSGAALRSQEASMVTERQEEPQKGVERRSTYRSCTVYGEFSRGTREL